MEGHWPESLRLDLDQGRAQGILAGISDEYGLGSGVKGLQDRGYGEGQLKGREAIEWAGLTVQR